MNGCKKSIFSDLLGCKAIFFCLSFFIFQNGFSQKFLTLQKHSFKNRIIYHLGDELTIKVDDNKFGITGVIFALGDSSINFNGQTIEINRIKQVMNYKKRAFHRAMTKQALVAIAPILVIDAGGRFFNTKQRPIISREAIRISAFFATVSLGFLPYRVKRYNVTKSWHLRVVDVTP